MPATPTLLATKLSLPQARAAARLVQRPRLIERLTEGLMRPLTLISAPAGFGKTTLIGDWHTSEAGQAVPLAWPSLDAEDNDPSCFLTYLIAAVQTLRSTIGEAALALLHSTPRAPLHSILTSLLNDLAGLPGPFALVLDDYHERGAIRRIAAVPNHYALGYHANGMTVWDVDDTRIDALGEQVGALEFVSHCYRRPRVPLAWPYNLFAMVHAETRLEVVERAEEIATLLGDAVRARDILFSTKILKKTGMRLGAE